MTNKEAIEIISQIEGLITNANSWSDEAKVAVKEALEIVINASKEERPQGEWIDAIYTNNGVGVGMCNQCGIHKIIDNFCPNCGADMRGEDNDK